MANHTSGSPFAHFPLSPLPLIVGALLYHSFLGKKSANFLHPFFVFRPLFIMFVFCCGSLFSPFFVCALSLSMEVPIMDTSLLFSNIQLFFSFSYWVISFLPLESMLLSFFSSFSTQPLDGLSRSRAFVRMPPFTVFFFNTFFLVTRPFFFFRALNG